ncbi:hypothetical protein WOLCODRAFT_135451 [Wolfiporia cocos MD-104 SS10]|uniref:Uncharacterized protein n=1 Tax=Wolfiporia cocos (strain MD-104) TaxID=742152 RepID=A0A2H3J8P6_WOLCO|nr:hypothetical protein WOLCODRAFT_135451 [Wolfiporia cocos MD-104 SS10]
MSFQQFRLSALPQSTSYVQDGSAGQSSLSSVPAETSNHQPAPTPRTQKAPYGSGDIDDGYTLTFDNMDAFQEWRQREEEEKMIEFVKGDTHGSKAVPPRFKDHTKLVCARHSRSGKKKYVKKYPDRVRKVPSRKLEGVGCPASISYKTYFDRDEVRVMYNPEHSHEIGLANLPFTRRGRKQQAELAHVRSTQNGNVTDGTNASSSPSAAPSPAQPNAAAGPSSIPAHASQSQPPADLPHYNFRTAISMVPPMPMPPPPPQAQNPTQERWDRLSVLFGSIREHGRTFEYPAASVAALETLLIRLYLESPLGSGMPQPQNGMGGMPDVNGAGGSGRMAS